MFTAIYEETDTEYAIIDNNISIILSTEHLNEVKQQIFSKLCQLQQENSDSKLDVIEWYYEAINLCDFAENLMAPGYRYNLVDYLPRIVLSPVVIAKSKFISGTVVYNKDIAYPVLKQLQLRLIPIHTEINDDVKVTAQMQIDIFNANEFSKSVFDEQGHPHKLFRTIGKYIDNKKVTAGHLYEDKSGNKWLCVSGCRYSIYELTHRIDEDIIDEFYYYTAGEYDYAYIKYTEELQKTLGIDTSFNNLIRVLATQDKTSCIMSRMTITKHPKKFTKEIGILFDEHDITSEVILGAAHRAPATYYSDWRQFRYEIVPYGEEIKLPGITDMYPF